MAEVPTTSTNDDNKNAGSANPETVETAATHAAAMDATPPSTNPSTVSSRRSSGAPRSDRSPDSLRRFKFLLTALVLIVSLATGFLGGWLGASGRQDTAMLNGTTASQRNLAASESQLISSIAKTVGPSVVSVNVVSTTSAGPTDFFGFSAPPRSQEAAGTGIIISSDGLIITNRHVVPAGLTSVSVTLSDGTEFEDVKVVGRTGESDSLDIAFLKISDTKGQKLVPAEIGDSGKVQVGDIVVAIGNALGQFNNTVTSGIISGFGRSVQAGDESGSSVENLNDLFQTDAAINQGNSGGPLVNSSGQVIGINTAVSGQGQNIGFAIPINDVNGLIKQVLKNGTFERSYLGVRYIPLTPGAARELDLDVTSGAYIAPAEEGGQPSIIEGSPADKAGLKEKDIITAVDGTKLDQSRNLTSLVGRKAVGETTKLTVIRDGKTISVNVTVGAAPQS
ncbi:MAG TPA: trypsin-like peptidase domain-containing protein [Candidatus Saccharimonadales bacterium]